MRSQWDKCENYEFDVYKKFDADKKVAREPKKCNENDKKKSWVDEK